MHLPAVSIFQVRFPHILLLLFSPLTHAHMEMTSPLALRSKHDPANTASQNIDYSNTSPLFASGANFPCKGYQNDSPRRSVATYPAGSNQTLTLAGSAMHGGGSCQVSLSYDDGKTFRVIQSLIGGCPSEGMKSWGFTVPEFVGSGEALLAWTWVNLVGNREFYMNCAWVTVTGGAGGTVGGGAWAKDGKHRKRDVEGEQGGEEEEEEEEEKEQYQDQEQVAMQDHEATTRKTKKRSHARDIHSPHHHRQHQHSRRSHSHSHHHHANVHAHARRFPIPTTNTNNDAYSNKDSQPPPPSTQFRKFTDLPFLWKANLPPVSDCVTVEGTVVVYPNPGPDVIFGNGMSKDSKVTGGRCDDAGPPGPTVGEGGGESGGDGQGGGGGGGGGDGGNGGNGESSGVDMGGSGGGGGGNVGGNGGGNGGGGGEGGGDTGSSGSNPSSGSGSDPQHPSSSTLPTSAPPSNPSPPSSQPPSSQPPPPQPPQQPPQQPSTPPTPNNNLPFAGPNPNQARFLPCFPGSFLCLSSTTWAQCVPGPGAQGQAQQGLGQYTPMGSVAAGMECLPASSSSSLLSTSASLSSSSSSRNTNSNSNWSKPKKSPNKTKRPLTILQQHHKSSTSASTSKSPRLSTGGGEKGTYRDDQMVRAAASSQAGLGRCDESSGGKIGCLREGQGWAVCDQGGWVDMGGVAAGMVCKGGALVGL